MTTLKHLTPEQKEKLTDLINKDLTLTKKQLDITLTMAKKLKKRIKFLTNVLEHKQSLENLKRVLRKPK